MCRFLGSVAVALFVSYAVQGKEVREWGEGLLRSLHTAKQYCEQEERDWKLIRDSWGYFEESWTKYLTNIGLLCSTLESGATDSIDLVSNLNVKFPSKLISIHHCMC